MENKSFVIQKHIPEPGIQQVSCSMLCSANVQINGIPIFYCFRAHKYIIITGIHISQKIPARPGPSRHGRQFIIIFSFIKPVFCPAQRRLACFCWQILIYRGQFKRKFIFRDQMRDSIFCKVNRNRLAPISLPAENSISNTVIYFCFSKSFLFSMFSCSLYSLPGIHAGDEAGINHFSMLDLSRILQIFCSSDYSFNS